MKFPGQQQRIESLETPNFWDKARDHYLRKSIAVINRIVQGN